MANFSWDSRSENSGNPHSASGTGRAGGFFDFEKLNNKITIP